jgi:tetrahydromethanopterin S-methyltransferase subunit A
VRILTFTILCGQNRSGGVETKEMLRIMANGIKQEERKK